MADYKIELGVKLNTSDLKKQINSAEAQAPKINLEFNTKKVNSQLDSIRKQIKNLENIKVDLSGITGGGKGSSKKVISLSSADTSGVLASFKEVKQAILDIRNVLGTIDDKSDMKSLLTSINQITASLGKASDETQTLVSSLNALSKKDFNFNFGFNMGKSASQLSSEQGDIKRNAISQLKQQAKALEDYFDQYYKVAQQGAGVAKLTQGTNVFRDYWELSPNIGNTKASLKQQVATYKQYIDLMQQAAKIKGVDLSGVVSGFSKTTDDIVKETKSATNSVEQFSQALKGLFGGGIDSESLTQILNDLKEINTAIKTLASDTSLGGLTQSFDNLSNTLKEITRDISTFAQAVNSGLVSSRDISSGITNEVKGISNSFKNAGTESANEFESGFKKAFNLDDVISKEVKGLMKAEGISTRGKTGKQAEEEISTAFKEYYVDGSEAGIRKVTDALLNNKRVVDDTKKVYQELDAAVRSINNGDVKVLLDKDIVSEYGDDFKEMQKLFGKGFVTRAGKNDVAMSFDEWFSGLPDTVTNALSDDYNRINAFGELFNQLQQQRSKAYMSTQEMISRGEFSFDEAESAIRSAVGNVQSYEQQIKQASDSATDAVVQNQRRQQEAYKATAETVMYHAGVISKLNKAETNGRFYGSERGTGYFGTGHYFVDSATKHELDNSSYSKLPYTSIDISKYDNLFDATSNEVAGKLHEFLKNLTRFTQGSDRYDMTELFAQFKSVFGDTIMDVQEFGNRIDKLKSFMAKSSLDDRSDSVSTQFMKSLGYEGVDTRGTDFADTAYGTVIYDLKEESVLQANITDELQKQGQMLEKINYEKGQVFDKDTDARIQSQLDAQAKIKEIQEEFNKSFDTTNLDKAESDLNSAQERLSEIDESINRCESGLRNASEEAKKFAREMEDFGLEVSDEEIKEFEQNHINAYQSTIDELTKEKADLEASLPSLEESYNKESQLANDAYNQAKQVVEQRYKEAQAAREVEQELNQMSQAANQTGNALDSAFEGAESEAKETTGVIENLKSTLQSMKVDRSSIDAIIKDVEELGFTAKDASVAMKNGNFDITVNGVDSIGRAITEIRHLDSATDEITGISRKISQSLSETDNFVKQQKRSVTDLTNQINELNRKAIDPNTSKPIKDESHLNSLKDKYNEVVAAIKKMGDASSSTFDEERNAVKTLISEYKSLTREYKNAETVATSLRSKDVDTVKATYASKLDVLISKMKDSGVYSAGFEKGAENLRSILSGSVDANGLVSFLNGLDKLDAGYKRAAQSAKSFEQAQTYGKRASGLESEIKNLQRISPEINQFEAEINGAKVSVQSLLKDLSQVKTKADFNSVSAELRAFKKAAEASGIAIRETAQQAKSIKEIKIKLSDTGFDGFEQEVARAHLEAEKLEGSYVELEAALKKLDVAMADVYSADQSGDVRKLVAANEEYEAALKGVYSQLKLNQKAEKQAYDNEILSQKKASLSSDMEIWLNENTRAAREFGEEIRRLQASLDGLDANGVKLAGQQFKNITKQAQAMGKTGLTVFDRLKSKAKEYAAYLSTAEIFMWAEQAFREMFNTVKEIDTAMTGLYRVTDLTAAEYDSLFNEMIGSAKEYGATLNDIINATTDWVRAGFDANTSLGLAEVTTMYQHISDLDYDTAAENLITAYNGFKDELNGAFSGDQVAAVEYIADIFNELDNSFAVTSAGLGEALTRSASALDLAGNTIQETAGMVTGIVEVTQDPEKAGSALKVLSLRLRGMKGQLEDLGEETDENVENISKMQGQILNMTKGKVNIFDGAGNFKSTYEIMQGIANVWDDLSSIDQADLLETIAGKNRANDVAALLSNWENVEAAVKSASEAEGSAARENAKYVDSIQGRLDKMTTSWQSFANTFMSSDFLKGAISALTSFIEALEKVIDTVGTFPTLMGTIAAGMSIFKNTGFFSVLNKDVAGAQQSLSLLGKSFKDISRDFQSGQGLFTSLFSKSITKSDVGYITEYFRQIKSGVPVGQAYANTLSNASVAGKKMAVNIKKGAVSIDSLKTATIGGKAALFGLEVAATAANIALTMGLSLAIQGIITLVSKWINKEKELAEEVESLTSEYKEQHDSLKKLSGDYDLSNEKSMISRYEKLSKGVSSLGENVSLTSDEYSEYQSIVNKIAEQIPSLVTGYDSQGNAILSCKGNVEELTKAYEDLIAAQNNKILLRAEDIEKDFENKRKDANSNTDGFFGTKISYDRAKDYRRILDDAKNGIIDTDTALDNLFDKLDGIDEDGNINSWENSNYTTDIEALSNALEDADFKRKGNWFNKESQEDHIKRAFKEDKDTVKKILDQYYADLEAEVEESRSIAQAILSDAFDISTSGYYGMSDTLKRVAEQTVNSLDFDFFDKLKEDGKSVKNWTNEMLDQLNSLSKDDNKAIEAAFDLQTKFNGGDIPYGEYVNGIENAGELIEDLKLKPEVESQLKLSLGLDEDGLVEQYDNLLARLTGKDREGISVKNAIGIKKEDAEKFLNSLSAEELSVAAKIIPEMDAGATIAQIQKAIDREVLVNGLGLDFDIDVETEWIEVFNNALSESNSITGLTADSIEALTNRYKELEGFDAESLFGHTAQGVKLNADAVRELESALKEKNKAELGSHMEDLQKEYENLTVDIENASDAAERANLYAQRDSIVEQINDTATLISQYEGLTSAFNEWVNAQEAADKGDSYSQAMTLMEDADELYETGHVGTNEFRAAAQFLSDEDLSSANVEEVVDAWVEGKKKFDKYFTEDESGSEKFLKDLEALDKGWAEFNSSTGEWDLDIDVEEAAKELGVSTSFIMTMLDELEARGIKINYEDDSLKDFKTQAEEAQEAYNKLMGENGEKKLEFKFGTGNIKTVSSQLDEAILLYDTITTADGKVNLDAPGAEYVRKIILDLIQEKQQLERPAVMDVEVNAVAANTEIGQATQKVQELQNQLWLLEQSNYNPDINVGDIKAKISDIVVSLNALEEKDPEIYAKLGLDASQTENIKSTISSINADIKAGVAPKQEDIAALQSVIGSIDTTVLAKYGVGDTTAIDEYSPEATGTVNWENNTDNVKESFSAAGTVNWENNTDNVKESFSAAGTVNWDDNTTNVKKSFSATGTINWSGTGPAAGTAHSGGTTGGRAFARGNWGIKDNGVALGGELGREIVVRDGKFFTIGDEGAQFFKYKKNDIVFNAAQTESLFKYGGIKGANPRGKMLATGSAFADGTSASVGKAFAYNEYGASGGGSLYGTVKKTTTTTTTTKTTTTSGNKGSSSSSSYKADGGGKVYSKNNSSSSSKSSESSNKDKDKEEFEETIDWIETKLSRIQRAIDKLDQKANNIYKKWSTRNKTLAQEIDKVRDEIELQQKAYDKYMAAAEGVGLSSSYASKVRNGEIDIETITDETLKEKISDYQTYYEKALACKDAIEELKITESELYKQRFDNVASEYDGILGVIEHEKNMLEEYISQSEAQAWLVSSQYYKALADNERDNITQLKKEQASLLSAFEDAKNSGAVEKNSEGWYEYVNAIDEVTLAIEQSNTQLLEYQQTIQQLSWEQFDLLQDKISSITEETEFLIELMSNKKLYDDNGQLTEEGKSTMGLHGVAYNVNMSQADKYAQEAARLKKELAKDPYDTELEERYREMISLQQEHIIAAEQEKSAIRDMVEEGIELEIDALQELIDKKNEELDSAKDLYEYNKQVKEQAEEIAVLEKEIAAYKGDNSEESRRKVQDLELSLSDAKTNLEETEQDRVLENTQKMLDSLVLEYETVLNMRLDNIDYLISQMITEINSDAGIIGDTIRESTENVGYTLSESMQTIWTASESNITSSLTSSGDKINGSITSSGDKIANVVTTYGDKFSTAQTTTNAALTNITTGLNNVVAQLNKKAETNTKKASTSSVAKPNTTTTSKPATTKPTTTTNKNTSSGGDGKPKVGDKVKFVSGQYYYDSQGKNPLGYHNRGKEVYITSINSKSWATHPYHISTGNKIGKGDLGWLKLNQLSGYATGKKNFLSDEVAWTQEKGREMIIRPSDGAILTPIAKGDSVLTSAASGNIWNMANNPAEFIKNNLNLGSSGVPNNSSSQSVYSQTIENVIFRMDNVKNYDEMLNALKSDRRFEKLITAMSIDRINGGSKLAKNKSIR